MEKKYLGNEKFAPETFKLSFLEEHNHTPLSEKENQLLDRDFGYKNIDELGNAFNSTKINEKLDKLFYKIANKLGALKS